MGGFFGIASQSDCMVDVFYGIDYHSHLGTYAGGMAAWDGEVGLQRRIHSISNAPFRTKFADIFDEMHGVSAIGCISDTHPQPLLVRSKFGSYALCMIGAINNTEELIESCLEKGCHFDAMTGGNVNVNELVAALISQCDDIVEGIRSAQKLVDGTLSLLILRDGGSIIAARDALGRLPVCIGRKDGSFAVSFEAYAYHKLDFEDYTELGPGEIVEVTAEGVTQLVAPGEEMRMCAFLWSYYGYPTSTYEGRNVEVMRYRNGEIMARCDQERGALDGIDCVGGVPDSGTPHAIGYANACDKPFTRAFIKYTPTWQRSFMPSKQAERDHIAYMKQILVKELIEGKKLLFVDDSIVRGTQLKETVQFLYENGAQEVHMRSACPPIMFGCRYLNFSRETDDMELLARRIIVELEGEQGFDYLDEYADGSTERGKNLRQRICDKFGFSTLDFQSLDGVIEAIGLEPCKLCTYCWNGKG